MIFLQIFTDGARATEDPGELNKDDTNENKHRLFIQSLLYQESPPSPFAFGQDSKVGRGVRKLYGGEEERKAECMLLLEVVDLQKPEAGRLESVCYVIHLGNIFIFLWLANCWERRQKIEKLRVLYQILTVLSL